MDATPDIRALIVDLKESQVHTFVPGRKITHTGSKKEKGVLDIFTEGKEILERNAFRDWKNRTGKLGADVFGCDAEYQRQQETVVGDSTVGSGEAGDSQEILVEFDVEAELERGNEI